MLGSRGALRHSSIQYSPPKMAFHLLKCSRHTTTMLLLGSSSGIESLGFGALRSLHSACNTIKFSTSSHRHFHTVTPTRSSSSSSSSRNKDEPPFSSFSYSHHRAAYHRNAGISCSSSNRTDDGGVPSSSSQNSKSISTLRNTQQIDWKTFTHSLGGTLVVSDEDHRTLVQQAVKENNLSFGFSAGGLLFPFYCGVSSALQDAGLLTTETKLGGASAGSLIAACIHSGMSMDRIVESCIHLMHDCRSNGTRGRLGPVLQSFLEGNLPEDAHERCSHKTFVAVTKALPYIQPVLISEFSSRDDLISALMTSCHIPWYLNGSSYTEFRGTPHLDGGLTNFIPVPPGTVGIRVSCFPSKQLSPVYRIGISPDTFDEQWPYSLRQMVQWAFEPADDTFVQFFIEKGRRDAEAWIKKMGLDEEIGASGGAVAAAKAAVVGGDSGDVQKEKERAGAEELSRR